MADVSPKYEARDFRIGAVVWFAASLLLTLVVTFVAIALFMRGLGRPKATQEPVTRIDTAQRAVPPPKLQINARTDLRTLRAREDAVLGTYGWIDRKAGVIRIPIERAIELTAERGLPARPAQGEPRP